MFGEVWLLFDVFGEVGLISVRVRRGRFSVGTCSAKSGYCRDLFGDVGLVSGLVRRGRVSVGMCYVRLA